MKDLRRLLELDNVEIRRSDARDRLREKSLKTYYTHPGGM